MSRLRMPGRTRVLALVAASMLALLVVGCGGGAAVQDASPAKAVEMLPDRVVIDVRTPAEFAAGHVAGAQNIDVEGGEFAASIEALDKSAPYLLYCRSGRRSAIAAEQMLKAGFTNVVDAGALEDLVAAGAPVE